jgi:hypothetical protein
MLVQFGLSHGLAAETTQSRSLYLFFLNTQPGFRPLNVAKHFHVLSTISHELKHSSHSIDYVPIYDDGSAGASGKNICCGDGTNALTRHAHFGDRETIYQLVESGFVVSIVA